MRRALLFFTLGTILISLSGCAKVLSAQDLAGTWTGRMAMSDADLLKQLKAGGKGDKDMAETKKQMGEQTVPLELKKDMTYVMGTGMSEASGNWTFAESKVTLTIEKAGGMTVDEIIKKMPTAKEKLKPMEFMVDKEGTTISGTLPGSVQGLTLSFTKPAPDKK